MARVEGRAVLIGSQTYGLEGVEDDVELLAGALSDRGFEVRVHVREAATRAAIVAAYERLIAETTVGSTDPVVVYYSGHGGRTALEGWEQLQREGRRSHLRYIVPFDMAASSEGDFRGLLAEELSDLQRRLTARTGNVTTILDCCHSATMSRGVDVVPKAVGRDFPIAGALPLLATLDADAGRRQAELDGSNRLAVRIVACDPLQSAYERDSRLGGRHGALTEQLVIALREVGDRPVSWRVLGDRIRRSVSAELPMQRPEIEGPADRLPFQLARRRVANALPVVDEGGAVAIPSARLFGLATGDAFRLVGGDDAELGAATVTRVEGDRAELAVDRGPGGGPLPADVSAVPTRTTSRRSVRVEVPAPLAAALTARIAESPLLRVARDDDREAPVATIGFDRGLAVRDGAGLLVGTPLPAGDAWASTAAADPRAGVADAGVGAAGEAAAGAAVAIVERIAKAERLRALASGGGNPDAMAGAVLVQLASHDDAGRRPRGRAGERLYPGERISLSITNLGSDTLYVGLFDIDTACGITLLSRDEPAGWRLPANETRVVGGPDGVALAWDATVPATDERLETLLVVAATQPQQFGLLETPGAAGARGAPASELESLLIEAGSGTRGWPVAASASGPAASYRVKAIDFYLVPGSKPATDEPPFAIREVPDASLRAARPRAIGTLPKRVAVRLVALRVRDNKALFRSAVRLDAMVITEQDGEVTASPFTARFGGIADGDLLPIDNLLVYLGPVRDFLDVAVWVNRDDERTPDLARLFEQAANDAGTQGALRVIGGMVLAAPQAATAVAAVAAVATFVRVAGGLVTAWAGREIGLYRTSFLASEQFGLGRQPAEGLRAAQGIEFALEVVDLGG